MKKLFLPLVLCILLVATATIVAVGEASFDKNSNKKICVESRSCAINYMNHLEKEKEQ